jgi:hypothetical protein
MPRLDTLRNAERFRGKGGDRMPRRTPIPSYRLHKQSGQIAAMAKVPTPFLAPFHACRLLSRTPAQHARQGRRPERLGQARVLAQALDDLLRIPQLLEQPAGRSTSGRRARASSRARSRRLEGNVSHNRIV